ncbi:MAG: hypothetical protein HY906_15170 [Deltaproteobacteria bacterium]|nr:hypothetical protein [Deltaproteobacteria bacterium]
MASSPATPVGVVALSGKTVQVIVTLCTDACAAGDRECVGDGLRTCEQVGACSRWGAATACPADLPYCSNGACAATCGHECAEGQRRCRGAGYQACGQHDSDTCRDWGPVIGCAAAEACREADGQCVPWCGGGPCPCTTGTTQACDDVGECRGGVRHCVDGQLGPCEWTVGPTPEVCDGKDNDCNGVVDDGLAAPACPVQAGVCAGALQPCGGAAGWRGCGTAQYQAAALRGATYEVTETICDGLDNDCNGVIDEAAGCCAPSCAGKDCGADDGCGRPCQAGACPANATCQTGACHCQYAGCGGECCAAGQVCTAGSCCTPDCTGRDCGPDPVCGQSCGGCGGTGTDCQTSPTCTDGQCKGQPRADGTVCGSDAMYYCLRGDCQKAKFACSDQEPGGYTLYSAEVIYGTGTVYPCPTQGWGTGTCTCDGLTFDVRGSGYECVSTTATCTQACVSTGIWRYCW